jgi:DNA polymerase I-like protein with 3'-5' exonuclease and polymerase domains
MIGAFATGLDIYRQVASKVLGVPAEEVTKEQRSVFKAIVLARYTD